MAKILVTGGCGYIGSHTLVDLINHGFNVVSIDNLSNSDDSVLEAIYKITGKRVKNYPVDLSDKNSLIEVFKEENNIAGIIHFAALKAVGESVEKPLKYYANNLGGLIHLLEAMNQFAIHPLIFSSSCSVYGNAKELPVTENTPWQPAESPYARTKQMGEEIINDTLVAHPNLKAIFLRYFNPAGAHESALMGESPINEANNLVPVITETAIGKRSSMTVFGTDYPTRDGSCIRDYIHIMDLANAHTKALQYSLNPKHDKRKITFNLGIGEGVTVLEAIRAFEKVSGQNLNYVLGARRPGDVVAIYANNKQAASILGWQPTRNIDEIMSSAWNWEKART